MSKHSTPVIFQDEERWNIVTVMFSSPAQQQQQNWTEAQTDAPRPHQTQRFCWLTVNRHERWPSQDPLTKNIFFFFLLLFLSTLIRMSSDQTVTRKKSTQDSALLVETKDEVMLSLGLASSHGRLTWTETESKEKPPAKMLLANSLRLQTHR